MKISPSIIHYTLKTQYLKAFCAKENKKTDCGWGKVEEQIL